MNAKVDFPLQEAAEIRAPTAERRTQRLEQLDSLRGLAAVSVVLGHLAEVILAAEPAQSAQWAGAAALISRINWTPLCLFTASGGQAVRFFFILSGLVLALPFLSGPQRYSSYVIKRVCRIYLPYAVALALAIAANAALGNQPLAHFGKFVQHTWGSPPTSQLVIQHIAMLGQYDVTKFDTVFWSLVQEMRISLLFPLVALVVGRWSGARIFLLGCILEATSLILCCAFDQGPLNLASFAYMVHLISLFLLGAVLAKSRVRIMMWTARLRTRTLGLTLAAVVVAYAMVPKLIWGNQFRQHVLVALAHRQLLPEPFNQRLVDQLGLLAGDWASVACAAALIALALGEGPFRRALCSAPLVLCGQMSYSLYLFHATVLWSLLYLIPDPSSHSLVMFAALYLVLTGALTAASYYLVEQPSIRLGRVISAAFGKPPTVARIST